MCHMARWLTAREAAETLGVSMRTLARYDERGVTRPIQVTPNAPRRYVPEDIAEILKGRDR
jgi:DNA-binding transcriptional MerR regulator